MRRLFALLSAVLLTVVGCNTNKTIDISQIDVNAVYESIEGKTTEQLVVLDDNYILNKYGVDGSALDGYVFAQSNDPQSAEAIIMFKCLDESKRQEIIDSIKLNNEQKVEELNNYNLPDEAKLVEDSTLEDKSGFVYLITSKNKAEIQEIIQDSIS